MNRTISPKYLQEKHTGDSILGGVNIGEYPRHNFIHNPKIEFENSWPLKVIMCGDDEWIKGCSRYRNKSDIFSLELITDGAVEFIQSGRSYNVKTGEIIVIQPGRDYVMRANEAYQKKVMTIDGYMLPTLLIAGGWSNVDVFKPVDPAHTAGYFDRIYNASVKREPGYLDYCSSQVYQLLLELSRYINTIGTSTKLNEVMRFIEENIADNPSMDTICDRFGLSRASLFRMFKKQFKVSPSNYIIRKRLLIARDLLETSHYSIKEIAFQLNYANQFFFSNQFKKEFMVSPSEYRHKLNSQ